MVGAKEYIITSIVSLIGAGFFWYGFNRMGKYQLIKDTPTSKIRSIAMGLVEIQGNVQAQQFLITPFSQSKCVYYKYVIEEYRKRTTNNSKGQTSTSYSWEKIASGEQRIPFYARDETGNVYIEPNGAEFNVPVKKAFLQKSGLFGAINTIVDALKGWENRKEQNLNVSSWGLMPIDTNFRISFGTNVGDRRYYEYFIENEEQLFVLGTASNMPNSSNIVIKKGEIEKTFLISNRSEKDLLKNLKLTMLGSFLIGGLLIILGVILLLNYLNVF